MIELFLLFCFVLLVFYVTVGIIKEIRLFNRGIHKECGGHWDTFDTDASMGWKCTGCNKYFRANWVKPKRN